MKTFTSITVFILLFMVSCSKTKSSKEANQTMPATASKNEEIRVIEKQIEPDTLKGSLKAKASGDIGDVSITIDYHSPAVRGRVIWGGLVPYDNVWVTGAHKATSIEFSRDVKIGGVTIPAGKYALFSIPGKEEWTIIINKNWDQHLADNYDRKDDVARIKVKPEIERDNQERLRYMIESENATEGEVVIYWEMLEISLPVSTKL
ncbi:MAG: hypothetical protein OJF59_001751 [Cytophagales bacterium]|jgi:hypothetical protein|nr:DUF2911 domain-containing protein [Bacteroidota bacterium]MBS1950772.1 DUF2911 domain-containing protein [Bacteroidota bacterium]MBS1980669.1 DUF2911 domain-containing protein [Bacteroidota bacterium]WHZ07998.1 MAG: hypothetical protein OJF59_001751 [Cytophagales bacterium]